MKVFGLQRLHRSDLPMHVNLQATSNSHVKGLRKDNAELCTSVETFQNMSHFRCDEEKAHSTSGQVLLSERYLYKYRHLIASAPRFLLTNISHHSNTAAQTVHSNQASIGYVFDNCCRQLNDRPWYCYGKCSICLKLQASGSALTSISLCRILN